VRHETVPQRVPAMIAYVVRVMIKPIKHYRPERHYMRSPRRVLLSVTATAWGIAGRAALHPSDPRRAGVFLQDRGCAYASWRRVCGLPSRQAGAHGRGKPLRVGALIDRPCQRISMHTAYLSACRLGPNRQVGARSCQFGRASAPTRPQRSQRRRGPNDGTGTSSR